MRTGILIILAAALLGGCFYAEDPLITRRAADFPLDQGRYSHTPYHPDGRPFDRPTWNGEIEREGWSYASDTEAFPHQHVRLRALTDGLYAAQRENDGNYLFGLVFTYPGGVVTYHNPSCSDLSETARERYALTVDMEEGTCRIERWDVLEAVLLTYLEEQGGAPRVDGVYRRLD
ncbi:hypothetical protein [Maricaulis sp.]|uniref:hypothetical protein n=1 Tax=Maricaulis sp. TaxID=1486257 RepID=UPI00262C8F63|nr:hypothetical protein [Maricaulis sp.]